MTHRIAASAPPVAIGNCFRCGCDFRRFGRERICPRCKSQAEDIPPKRSGLDLLGQPLSFRESQIVDLVEQGLTNDEIGTALCLRTGTVKQYLSNIFDKVGTDNRVKLAIWSYAVRNGLRPRAPINEGSSRNEQRPV
jgi:DNA-binding NarL/FixJ family response regulator